MTLCAPDREIEANGPLLAAAILARPLAVQAGLGALDVLAAIAREEPWVRAEDARRIVRLALVAIDAVEIAASMEAEDAP